MNIQRYHGRPDSNDGRLEKEIRVYELLEQLEIDFDRVDHEPAMTMEICKEIDLSLGAPICKNLFLCNRQKTNYYLLMMPKDKPFKTKELSAQIQSARLSFADADAMGQYLDITPGSVSVLGLMNDHDNRVRLLVDEDLILDEYIGCHPCINTSSLKLRTRDVLERFLPAVHHDYTTVRLVAEV